MAGNQSPRARHTRIAVAMLQARFRIDVDQLVEDQLDGGDPEDYYRGLAVLTGDLIVDLSGLLADTRIESKEASNG